MTKNERKRIERMQQEEERKRIKKQRTILISILFFICAIIIAASIVFPVVFCGGNTAKAGWCDGCLNKIPYEDCHCHGDCKNKDCKCHGEHEH